MLNQCGQCERFESIVDSTPAFIKNDFEIDKMGMYCTDVMFGTGREKSPLVIVGMDLGRKLKRAFNEIDLERVLD